MPSWWASSWPWLPRHGSAKMTTLEIAVNHRAPGSYLLPGACTSEIAKMDSRLCEGCGGPLVRRANEHDRYWATRRFCSPHCWDTNRPVTKPKVTGRSRANVLYPGEPCSVCGKPYGGRGNVQRHHVDGDTMNNGRTNIAFLCITHHMQAHRLRDGHGPGGGARPRVAKMVHDRAVAKFQHAIPLSDAGLIHEEIALRLGVSRSTVSRWFRKYEQGKSQ